MPTQKDILDELSKELLVEFIKQGIRGTYPKPLADIYCRQVDDAKQLAKLLEKMMQQAKGK